MATERGRFVELPGKTKWASFHADQPDESSSNLDPAFTFEGVSEFLRSTFSVRTFARTNTLAERAYTRMRYALGVGHLALRKYFRLATLARCFDAGAMPAGYAHFQLIQVDAAHANVRSRVVVRVPTPMEFGERLKRRLPLEGSRFSLASPLDLTSDRAGSKGLRKVWAFRAAILELGQPSLLAMHVVRISDCIGPIIALIIAAIGRLRCIPSFPERMIGTARRRRVKRARGCVLHEIFARVASAFNTLADEHSTHRSRADC